MFPQKHGLSVLIKTAGLMDRINILKEKKPDLAIILAIVSCLPLLYQNDWIIFSNLQSLNLAEYPAMLNIFRVRENLKYPSDRRSADGAEKPFINHILVNRVNAAMYTTSSQKMHLPKGLGSWHSG